MFCESSPQKFGAGLQRAAIARRQALPKAQPNVRHAIAIGSPGPGFVPVGPGVLDTPTPYGDILLPRC